MIQVGHTSPIYLWKTRLNQVLRFSCVPKNSFSFATHQWRCRNSNNSNPSVSQQCRVQSVESRVLKGSMRCKGCIELTDTVWAVASLICSCQASSLLCVETQPLFYIQAKNRWLQTNDCRPLSRLSTTRWTEKRQTSSEVLIILILPLLFAALIGWQTEKLDISASGVRE
jgi:hypothetical protein